MINIKDVVNCCVNPHASSHKKQCFKNDPECRHQFPVQAFAETVAKPFECSEDWFTWFGERTKKITHQVDVKRNAGDLYMNCHCPVVSESVLACNSNISPTFTGRHCIHMTNHSLKGTQEDDSESFKQDARTVKRRFTHHMHETEKSKATSRLLSAVFSHTRAHVISAPLARFLIKHNSRFLFSHQFVHVPLTTFNNALMGRSFQVNLRNVNGFATLNARVFNYIFCPKSLEHLSVMEFFTQFDVVVPKKRGKANAETLRFEKNHPECKSHGLKQHKRCKIPKFSCWIFPDAKRFGGSMFKDTLRGEREKNAMDECAKCSLILLYPFRNLTDLTKDNSFRKKLFWMMSKKKLVKKEQKSYKTFKISEMMLIHLVQMIPC